MLSLGDIRTGDENSRKRRERREENVSIGKHQPGVDTRISVLARYITLSIYKMPKYQYYPGAQEEMEN